MNPSFLPLKGYNKPPLPISEQVDLLASRGVVITRKETAANVLRHINYYRFSGYGIPFEITRHKFIPGTKFEDILALYNFDHALRLVMQDALGLYESTIRTIVARHLSSNYSCPFIHENHTTFYYDCNHLDLITQLHKDADKAGTELFIEHYKTTYADFPKLPIWILVEVTTFGTLSKLVSGLKFRDQSLMSAEFKLPRNLFVTSLHTAAYVRNLCAHHRRLWNRDLAISMKLPNDAVWNPINPRKISSLIYLLSQSLKSDIFPKSKVLLWKSNLANLLDSPPPVPNFLQWMGLTPAWETHPLWRA